MTLSDKDMLTAALTNQKVLADQYLDTADHAASPAYLNLLMDICQQEQQARLQIYQMMHQRGWYTPQSIDQQQLQQARQTFSQVRHEISRSIQQASQAGGSSTSWSQSYGQGQYGQSQHVYNQQGSSGYGHTSSSPYQPPFQ